MSIKNKNAANHLSGRKRAAGRVLSPACRLLVFATCATAVFSAQAQAQPTLQADVQTFAIPAGDLTPALQSLASSARVILTFTPEQTRGKSTAGLQGRYGLSEAFSHLLAGSGLRQLKLGILAGFDEATASARINQYERGIHTPDFALACRLAEVLNIPACYFYTVEDDLAEVVAGWYQR